VLELCSESAVSKFEDVTLSLGGNFLIITSSVTSTDQLCSFLSLHYLSLQFNIMEATSGLNGLLEGVP
jgi:hypothetical protein